MSNVSLTIDSDDTESLVAGATMLLTLAGKVPAIELDDINDLDSFSMAGTMAEILDSMPPIDVAKVFNLPATPAEPVIAFGMRGVVPPVPEAALDKTLESSVPLDVDGLPWDARIHSGGKSTIKSGAWKKKKGVDQAVVDTVEAELRALMGVPVQPVPPAPVQPVPPAPVQPVPPAPVQSVPPAPVQSVPPAPVQPVPPAPVQPVPSDAPTSFAEFIRACSLKIKSGAITMERIIEIVNAQGLGSNLQNVAARPDLIPQIWTAINDL